jgi:hypothetical protein
MHPSTQPAQKRDGPDNLVATLNLRNERLARAAEAADADFIALHSAPLIERRHSLPPYDRTYKQID